MVCLAQAGPVLVITHECASSSWDSRAWGPGLAIVPTTHCSCLCRGRTPVWGGGGLGGWAGAGRGWHLTCMRRVTSAAAAAAAVQAHALFRPHGFLCRTRVMQMTKKQAENPRVRSCRRAITLGTLGGVHSRKSRPVRILDMVSTSNHATSPIHHNCARKGDQQGQASRLTGASPVGGVGQALVLCQHPG